MATRRQLRNRIAELETRDTYRLTRITNLEAALATATVGAGGNARRMGDMASRVIDLERELAAKDEALQKALRQLDDAMGVGPAAESVLDAAGARERERRAKPGVTA